MAPLVLLNPANIMGIYEKANIITNGVYEKAYTITGIYKKTNIIMSNESNEQSQHVCSLNKRKAIIDSQDSTGASSSYNDNSP